MKWKMKNRGCKGILRETVKGVLGKGKRVMKVRGGGDDAAARRGVGGVGRREGGGRWTWRIG